MHALSHLTASPWLENQNISFTRLRLWWWGSYSCAHPQVHVSYIYIMFARALRITLLGDPNPDQWTSNEWLKLGNCRDFVWSDGCILGWLPIFHSYVWYTIENDLKNVMAKYHIVIFCFLVEFFLFFFLFWIQGFWNERNILWVPRGRIG